jgi:1-acyl-sn-glycerol-3-phosphate acyltransferase
MRLARSLLFALLFYPGTFLFVLACFVAAIFGSGAMRATVHRWTAFNAWLCRVTLGIESRLEGKLPTTPHLIAVKHESMFETMEMVRLTRLPVIVLKRELSDLPLFGWTTRRYGVIPVDRGAGAGALRAMLTAGKQAVAEGRSIIIYPEGTRVPVGQRPPLRPGFAGLYRMLGLPVVPVALNSGRLWNHGLFKRAGVVTFRVGETIPPGLGREEVESRVHAAINVLNSAEA